MSRQRRSQQEPLHPTSTSAKTSFLQTRPFSEQPQNASPTPDNPDLQTQLNAAARFGHRLSQIAIQPKLTVGAPGDRYEQEADSVASQVMSMSEPSARSPIQRETAPEEEELQMKPLAASITPLVQREAALEDEELQMKPLIQREAALEDEEELQMKPSLQRSPEASFTASDTVENQLNNSKGSGSPLPNEVRSFMEPRFGVNFSQVRVHTDSNAVQMNRNLGAQAFTHGHDVYFGAGKSPTDLQLTAHELTHVVQQTGGESSHSHTAGVQRSAINNISKGTANTIQRNPLLGFPSSSISDLPDMHPVNWSELAQPQSPPLEIAPVEMKRAITGSHPPAAPLPPASDPWASLSAADICNPNHHAPPRPRFDFSTLINIERQQAWSAIGQDISAVQDGWNAVVPLANAFNIAENDRTLQNPEFGLQPFDRGVGTLEGLAGQQRVPRTGARKATTVDSLFELPQSDPDIRRFGTDVNITSRESRGIDRASQSSEVEQAVLKVQAVEAELQSAVSNVQAKVDFVEAAAHSVDAAAAGVRLVEAQHQQADAQSQVDSLKGERDRVKNNVKTVITLVKSLVSLGVAAGAGAASASASGASGGLTLKDANGPSADILGVIADRIVDAAYAEQISEAQTALSVAIASVRQAAGEQATSALLAANSELQARHRELNSARFAVVDVLIRRRSAYSQLATSAARRSGGSTSTQDRIAGMVAAIPIVEVVVARSSSVLSAAERGLNVSYSNSSGIGFSMARYAGYSQADSFVNHLAMLRGLQIEMTITHNFWRERLSSLQAIVTRLGQGIGASGQ